MPSLPVAVLDDPATLAEALTVYGACLLEGSPDPASTVMLRNALKDLQQNGALRPAQVGHGIGQQLRLSLRGDVTGWLERDASQAASDYLASLQRLRLALNEKLFMGLSEEEAHFACYPVGACYPRHRDQFHGTDTRVLSMVSYLNHDWSAAQGGALRLYLPSGSIDVLPRAGTTIVFLSSLEHEVLPATRERLSIAAWLRKRMP
ncbi:MAG: 2OG-Fe(II) oxygenase [Pseudoxanthomonas sp.]